MDGQGVYRMVRDAGWKIERIPRMHGMSLHITDPERPGQVAGIFGSYGSIEGDKDGEMAAWEALARTWNEDEDDFWHKEPD